MLTDKRIAHCFELARKASQFSDYPQHQLGAVLIYKGKTLSVGWNSNRTSPIQKAYNRERGYDVDKEKNSLHAEIHCLLKTKDMGIDYSKSAIFVYREHKNGELALAKPCPACRKYIKDIGIKEIYYTGEGSYIYERMK